MTPAFGSSSSSYDWETLFDSYRWDSESGFYQVRYRYLHPTLGRWITRDPLFEPGFLYLNHPVTPWLGIKWSGINAVFKQSEANLLIFLGNRPLYRIDFLGLWYDSITNYLSQCEKTAGYNTQLFCTCVCAPITVPETSKECEDGCSKCASLVASLTKGRITAKGMCECECEQENKKLHDKGKPQLDCAKLCDCLK
jgi:RHS repeat-associated protein